MPYKCIHLVSDTLSGNVLRPIFVNEQEIIGNNENNVSPSCDKCRYMDPNPNAETKIKDVRCCIMIKKLQDDYNKLKDEQKHTFEELESTRKTFQAVTTELSKQLDTANKRESEIQSEMLRLSLENEKLRVLLESEKNIVEMLKKELLGVKRALQFSIIGTGTPAPTGCEESQNISTTPRNVRFVDCRCRHHDHDLDQNRRLAGGNLCPDSSSDL